MSIPTSFLSTAGKSMLLINSLLLPGVVSASDNRPNIVFILADDWGWTDWQMNGDKNGSTFYETPNLNKLASEGVCFSQAYATPLSSPTRAALLTGKYPGARLHMHQAITGDSKPNPILPSIAASNVKTLFPESKNHLPIEEITIAEELKRAGYKTFHYGKWHLGNKTYYPINQGFDSQFAVGGAGPGSGGYFAPYAGIDDIPQGPTGEYLTERLTDEVCKKIEQVKNDKFFIYFTHYNVHSPYQAKNDLVSKYSSKIANDPTNKHKNPVMAAMIESLDASIGKVMDKLNELGIADKTMIVVMGDNGGIHWANDNNPIYSSIPTTTNSPLRAGKSCFYEGGVRVPLIIKYPAMIDSGRVENTPVHIIDFYPTLCELSQSGISPSKDVYDGVSILPLLNKSGNIADRPLYCHFPRKKQIGADVGGSFIRLGDYKLCRMYGLNPDASDAYELYNIRFDMSESKDSAKLLPDIVNSMKTMLNNWLIETKALVPKPNPAWNGAVVSPTLSPSDLIAEISETDGVSLSWQDNSENEHGFIILRSESNANNWITIDSVATNEVEYVNTGLESMKYYFYRVNAHFTDSVSSYSNTVATRRVKKADILPTPWLSMHIGQIASESYAEYSDNTITVDAADFDAWGAADRVHYIYQPASGTNAEMVVNITQLDNVQSYAQGGIMFRETLDAGSKMAFMLLAGDKRKIMRDRIETNGVTNQKPLATTVLQAPYWLKLVRSGNNFSGYYSNNGISWTLERTISIPMGNEFYVGLASASHEFTKNSIIKYTSIQTNIATSVQKQWLNKLSISVDNFQKIITINNLKNGEIVSVFDASGRRITSTTNSEIDISDYKPGVYVISAANTVSKITIQ
jgi:arylsulfatase A